MNADSTPDTSMITAIMRASPRPAQGSSRRPSASATPVRVNPALRMNMAQTVMTAGLLKPASASAGVSWPVTASVPIASSATRSARSHSVTNSTRQVSRMPSTRAIETVTPPSIRDSAGPREAGDTISP